MRCRLLLAAMIMGLAWELRGYAGPGEAAPASHTDRYGDPLPAGAIQRFGTSRFWAERSFLAAGISPDGALIASGHEYGSIRLWDTATGKQVRLLTAEQGDEVLAA